MNDENVSVLEKLDVRKVPTPGELLAQVKEALRSAGESNVWKRMRHNHDARVCNVALHDPFTCRKPTEANLPNGLMPADIFPWPGAASLEVKLTDEIINEMGDLLQVAVSRARPEIMPKLLDTRDDRKMKLAQGWGAVAQHHTELTDYEYFTALEQWGDRAWEYGHGLIYIGWKEEKQLEKRVITGEQVLQLFTAAAVQAALDAEQMTAAEEGREPVPMEDTQLRAIQESAAVDWEQLLLDPTLRTRLQERLLALDPAMTANEAGRVATALRRGEEATYYVAQVLRSVPDVRALTNGLDVFCPEETRRIQHAAFVVMAEWLTRGELQGRIATDDYDKKAVETALRKGPSNLTTATVLGMTEADWVLSGGTVGRPLLRVTDNKHAGARWQVLTVYYRAIAQGDVAALYKTVLTEFDEETPLKHECCEHMHGCYPFADYVREPKAATMWESRGVGELSFSEQDEIRIQVNQRADNASLTIAPPLEVPVGSLGSKIFRPRAQFPVKRVGDRAFQKIDVAGDGRPSIEVEKSAMERSNRYWKRGMEVDPIAKSNRQEKVVRDWLLAVKQVEKLRFKVIQQFTTGAVKIGALNGRAVDISLTEDEIQGEFSVQLGFDVGTLDSAKVESRAKLVKEYMVAMDRGGQLDTGPLLKLLAMGIHPSWADLIVKDSDKAAEDEQNDVADVLNAALNGIEKPYVAGKNHAARLQMLQQLINLPMLDAQGQPVTDPQTGQPVPGRVARIVAENPDVAVLVQKRLEFEHFQDQQFDNAQTGRDGVKPVQQPS